MMTLEQCRATQKTIQEVIKVMRESQNAHVIWCNLLENHTNALLEHLRKSAGWCRAELPNIST